MATITYKVTVATGTTQYGTGNRFYINGELAPVLYLQEGNTYIFDQTDSTNTGHQIAFSTTDNGIHATPAGTAYTTGITYTGSAGSTGKLTFDVAPVRTTGAPLLFYYCIYIHYYYYYYYYSPYLLFISYYLLSVLLCLLFIIIIIIVIIYQLLLPFLLSLCIIRYHLLY